MPLIVITADRPPELRDCASGQTIDQHRLFGKYANWYHEMAVPELDGKLFAYLRQTTRQAWTRANTNGPVHLNTPFRDPLPPVADEGAAKKFSEQLDEGFFAIPDLPEIQTGAVRFVQRITTQRGLIIAGPAMPADPAAYVAHILSLSATTGWPILADALSPLRQGAAVSSNVIAGYDIILRNEALARDLNPRYVVALESWPTSKALRNWLESSQAEMVMVSEREGSRDAVHGRTREITASPMALQIDGHTSNLGSFANS
ncbi:MAG: 2-succinyl-5-enolpyruvyl-6-hydroxy-3-cyclohexene-1-carboxylic-acid synthase, partial [Verrucomicrobiia bacterium]